MLQAQDVADYFLWSQEEDTGEGITNMKLQKLLYYAQGFHIALYAEPLFPEPIEAWMHGPVVRSVWEMYRDYAADPLPRPAHKPKLLTGKIRSVLDEVSQVYGQYSAGRLRDMTHQESPWREAFDEATSVGGEISQDTMEQFFRTRLI